MRTPITGRRLDEIMDFPSRRRVSRRYSRHLSKSGSGSAGEKNSGQIVRSFDASSRRYVLDANALIGFFEGRLGVSERARGRLREAVRQDVPLLMSAVNWAEVFYMEWRYHGEAKAREAEGRFEEWPVAVISVDRERASRVGALR